ncbi:hypothetical protein AYI70_g11740 [Smittium culicis]|uniref:Uncharacterized protein n=1 Tax=Smittium culicis TaxID=133412 RepID=A0A1R1X0J6_9FUNG|nr:hypothetical protein AYI70_g11740 [Smittium culicis]
MKIGNSDEEDIDNNYITARSQIFDLQTYPKLIESLPSLEDIFRAPLSKDPPLLNNEASYGIKKMDTSYYNIQSFLDQATRPRNEDASSRIRNYDHSGKVGKPAPGIKPSGPRNSSKSHIQSTPNGLIQTIETYIA